MYAAVLFSVLNALYPTKLSVWNMRGLYLATLSRGRDGRSRIGREGSTRPSRPRERVAR